jgi:serine protease AprX
MRLPYKRFQKPLTLTLLFLLSASPVLAGLTITRSSGIATTGADGITFINTSGIATTGADGLLTFAPNGIATTGADGIATTGADGVTFTSGNGIATTGADSMIVNQADGIAVTGADGIAVTGADGQTYHADALNIRQASGIATTGADGLTFRGVSGIATTGADSFTIERADGIATTGADTFNFQNADSAIVTSPDGTVFAISPNGIAVTGADNITFTYATGIAVTGADGIATTGADGIATTGADQNTGLGLQSVDPELAILLYGLLDDSNINAIVVYHHLPTDADLAELQGLGILGGTRFRSLPMIAITTTKQQLIRVSQLPAVRSIYGNRTLQSNSDPYLQLNCAPRIPVDGELTSLNQSLPVSGRDVTVAVLDTGVDGTHADLAGRVVQNVKVLDTQSLAVGFINPINIENLPNTDQLYGHGTFVAGVVAGSGARSGGRYAGVAPGARILGISAGDLTLSFVLSGFDYLLTRGADYNVRVVNCSFSANTVFDFNDPVNIATKILTERGVNVVFSAGNTGPGMNTLNPYAVAPWVISVGATDHRGRLANFSSRGAFANALFKPTLVAPGVSVIAPRTLGLTGILGLLEADTRRLTLGELPFYTTASGTSFSAPQAAATVAMMLEVNPNLSPSEVRDILQRTATPMPQYYQHEVGAGMLSAHAAVIEAAFPQRRLGTWRASLNKGNVRFITDMPQQFSGTVSPFGRVDSNLAIPENALLASVQIAWGGLLSLNDLGLTLYDARGTQRATANTLNLPGLTGKRERIVLNTPSSGTWRARTSNSSFLSFTSQPFSGALEVTRAQFAPVSDLSTVSAASRAEIYQALRTRVMSVYGNNFRPTFKVTRSALAEALVSDGCVPQYLAAQPRYGDVRDLVTRNFVESAQFSSNSALFPDATGANFRPNDFVDRLTAAVVLVRAAGLKAEAESQNGGLLSLLDLSAIPANMRGYVAVAISRGLLTAEGNFFRPGNSLTRAELAHALVAIQRLATQ